MCGIAGILSWKNKDNSSIIQRMTHRLSHRGPDADGHWCNGAIALGHRRLSIQDTSNIANQPMHDVSGRYTIVFNGEIYNFQKLQKTLMQFGYDFKTHGDTEVILNAWHRWGIDALSHFEGMFAFALWDNQEKVLYLIRDRFGEKPLYYFMTSDNEVVFASELKSLLTHPDCPSAVNPNAISQFLSLNYILTDQCIFNGIYKLPPAHYAVFKQGEAPQIKQYWSLAEAFYEPKWSISESELIEQFNELFTDVIKDCSLSDVPLGLFLSGGMDSSTIAAAISKASSYSNPMAFTIGFKDKSYDELDKAKVIADHTKIKHFCEVRDSEDVNFVKSIVEKLDEPFADTSMIPVYVLSGLARKNATVCLSGDGGDELFGGYETYKADIMHNFFRHIPFKNGLSKLVQSIPVSLNKVSLDYKLKQFTNGLHLSPQEAHYSWRTIFSESEKQVIINSNYKEGIQNYNPFTSFSKFYNDVKDCSMLEQHFYVDMRTWMVDDILVKVDRISMMHSLEVRAPFLNHRLAEWIIRLPTKYKINNLRTKYLLKKSQEQNLPHSIIYGKKEGFSSPVSEWIKHEVLEQIMDNPIINDWFDKGQIYKLWQDHSAKRMNCSYKLFGLFCLSSWTAQLLRKDN